MFDVNDLKKKVEEKGEELKEKSAEHLENLKEKSAEHIDTLKKTIEENQDDWKEKSAEHLENLKENVSSNWREIFFGSWKRTLITGIFLIGLWSFFTSNSPTDEEIRKAEQYFQNGNKVWTLMPLTQNNYELVRLWEESIVDYTHAIELNPNVSKYYKARGEAHSVIYHITWQSNNLKMAIDDFEKAIDLNPNHPLAKQFIKDMPHR